METNTKIIYSLLILVVTKPSRYPEAKQPKQIRYSKCLWGLIALLASVFIPGEQLHIMCYMYSIIKLHNVIIYPRKESVCHQLPNQIFSGLPSFFSTWMLGSMVILQIISFFDSLSTLTSWRVTIECRVTTLLWNR